MKKFALCAVVMAVALSSASTAQAGGWLLWWQVNRLHNHQVGRAPYGSYYGSYGSQGFSCWGSLPRLFVHRFGHGLHRTRGPLWGHGGGPAWMNWDHAYASGWDGGAYVGHYGDGEVVHGDGYPLHGGDWGGEWGGEGAPSTGPALPAPMGEELVPPPPPKEKGASIRFRLSVPSDAVVFVNDELTTSTGELRQYVSRNVNAGATHNYTIRAEVMRDGQLLSQVKTLKLRAGGEEHLAFEFPQQGDKPTTALILRVPADARVILSGVDTKSTGAEREFATKLLSKSAWADYSVRVELERNGRTLVHEQSVTLSPGDRREMTIDFAAEVASSR